MLINVHISLDHQVYTRPDIKDTYIAPRTNGDAHHYSSGHNPVRPTASSTIASCASVNK